MVSGAGRTKGTRMSARNRRILWGVLAAFSPVLCTAPGVGTQQADGPLRLPKSDVVVTYQLDNVPLYGPHKLQVTYILEGERVRLDFFHWMEAKVPFQSVIFDRTKNRRVTVYPEMKAFSENPAGDDNPGILLRADAKVSRQGNAVVAHAPCTEWRIEAPANDAGDTACVTDDGILLRLVASNRSSIASMVATTIHYGAPPDGTFDPPTGFKRKPRP